MTKQKDFAVPINLLNNEIAESKAAGIDFVHFRIDDEGRLWLDSANQTKDSFWDSFPPPPGG